jgi:predicted transposase/invertase (TIGR01784 family)
MGANVKYKDSVFSFLFSDPDLLRELYGALEGVSLPADIPVTINTLQDVLFKDRINDISFAIGDKLVILIEHQSTINPNIALRLLFYISEIYGKIIEEKNIYSSRLARIPRPEFFVLYNGLSPFPDEKIIKLSDAFESGLLLNIEKKASFALELEVRVININQGRNKEIAEKCKTLGEYSAFVQKVRDFRKEADNLDEAVENAVIYCRDHDILKEFLEENAKEVLMNMLHVEWNMETALAYQYKEGREDGIEEGRAEGEARGEVRGRAEGEARSMEKVARNALAQGASPEFVQKITGLEIEAVKKLTESQSLS